MDNRELYCEFIRCMAAFLRGEKRVLTLSAADWGKLYALAKRQSLSGALYGVVDGCDMPDAVRDRLRRDAFLTLARYESQQQALHDMIAALEAADVAHLLFKGAVVRQYYPDPAMRSMGDIDAAVHAHARVRADAALQEAGFEKAKEQPDVWVYTRADVLIEMHTQVKCWSTDRQETVDYEELWTDARQKKGVTYHLSDAAQAAFTLSHMASHFCSGGCGLRQLMDVAVLFNRFPDLSLWEDVLDRLKATGLDRFARHMLWLCRTWFDVEVSVSLTAPLDSSQEEHMQCHLLDEGTFGTDERVLLARMRKDRRLRGGSAAGTLRRWLFPSASYLRRQYGYAENPLLLPAAYVHRLFDGVTKNRRTHEARLKYAGKQRDALEDEVCFFESIGL